MKSSSPQRHGYKERHNVESQEMHVMLKGYVKLWSVFIFSAKANSVENTSMNFYASPDWLERLNQRDLVKLVKKPGGQTSMQNTAYTDVFNSTDQIIWWAAPDDDVICTFM